jgi:type IV secretion system protein TrbL
MAGLSSASASSSSPSAGAPAWAQRQARGQAMKHGASAAIHTVRSGDHGSGSNSVPLKQDDRS